MLVELVSISSSFCVTVLDSVLIEPARADNPVDESVIAAFKLVIFTDVDILLAELTPATYSMLEAFCDMAVLFDAIDVDKV